MLRQLNELGTLAFDLDCVVVGAGDIFDKWNCTSELINFAISGLPNMSAVPGQHDLAFHNLEDIWKSSYQTLALSNAIRDLSKRGEFVSYRNRKCLQLVGFPWKAELKALGDIVEDEKDSDTIYVAVVHKYCWLPTHNPAKEIRGPAADFMRQLEGFDVIVVGDNHSGFIINKPNQSLINCGTFFRRRTDERNYRPMVGLLLASGKIVPYYMDVSQDKFIEQAEKLEELQYSGFSEFVTELERLESDGLDFVDALTRAMKMTVSKEGRKLILEALEGAKE